MVVCQLLTLQVREMLLWSGKALQRPVPVPRNGGGTTCFGVVTQ